MKVKITETNYLQAPVDAVLEVEPRLTVDGLKYYGVQQGVLIKANTPNIGVLGEDDSYEFYLDTLVCEVVKE